MTEDFETKLQ